MDFDVRYGQANEVLTKGKRKEGRNGVIAGRRGKEILRKVGGRGEGRECGKDDKRDG